MDDYNDNPIRMLLVHGNQTAAQHLHDELVGRFSFRIAVASSLERAAQELAQHPQRFDIVLVDGVAMEPANGMLVATELVRRRPFLPVVLLTDGVPQRSQPAWAGDLIYRCYEVSHQEPVERLAQICRRAAGQRTVHWQKVMQEISQSLHALRDNDQQLLEICLKGLHRLGYADVAIYRHLIGYAISDEFQPGFRETEQKSYLYRELPRSDDDAKRTIPLDQHPDFRQVGDSQTQVLVIPVDDETEHVLIILRGDPWIDPDKKGLLGLIALRHQPAGSLTGPERANLRALAQQVSLAMQNVLAYRQLIYQRGADERFRETYLGVLYLKAADRNTDKILDLFAQAIADALKFRRVAISTVDYEKNEVVVRGLVVLDADEERRVREQSVKDLPEFVSLHKQQFLRQTSYFIPDGAYEAETYGAFILEPEAQKALPWEWHNRDILRTPVVSAEGRPLGFISSDLRADGLRPDENTFRALEDFALQIAAAIENIEHYRVYDSFEAIEEIGQQFSRAHQPDELFKLIHKALKQLMQAAVLIIGRYDREHHKIEILYRTPKDETLPKHRLDTYGLTGYIVRNSAELLLPTEAQITQFLADHPEIERLGSVARSWIGVPLKVDDKVIGVIALKDYEREHVYDEFHLRILRLLANQIAIAFRRIVDEEANFEAVNKVGWELASAEIDQQFVERRIIEEACRLSQADYGVMLHYEREHNHLRVGQLYMEGQPLPFFIPSLPLDVPPGEKAGLSVLVARSKKPQRWDTVKKEPDYIKILERSQSQISLPLLARDASSPDESRLLGVLTLESSNPEAFDQTQQQTLILLCRYASLALLRATEQDQIAALLGWGMYDLSSKILGHRQGTDVRLLYRQMQYLEAEYNRIFRELTDLHTQATRTLPDQNVFLEQMTLIDLKGVIEQFITNHAILYEHPTTIKLMAEYSARSEQTILANGPGITAILRILIDNAFEQLQGKDYGEIIISTEVEPGSVMLGVYNSGPSLKPETVVFLEHQEERRESSHGLMQLKLLAMLFDAKLDIAQNDTSGVEFVLTFPQPTLPIPVTGDNPPIVTNTRLSTTQIRRLQRSIAQHSALLFTAVVNTRGRKMYQRMEELGARLSEARAKAEALQHTDVNSDLGQPEYLNAHAELQEFYEKRKLLQSSDIPLHFEPPDFPDDIHFNANRLGLRHVLNILVDNAVDAIRQAQSGSTSGESPTNSETITISAELKTDKSDEEWVCIQVHNTGTHIPPADALRLFSHRGVSQHIRGRGLLMSKFLLAAYNGTIELSGNDEHEGVRFTIKMQRVGNPMRGGQ